jgi:excisionase family DNA binding protein
MTVQGLITVEEVASFLGVSPCTVYRLEKKGDLPSIRGRGLGIRFKKEEIDSWLEKRKTRPLPLPSLLEPSLALDIDLDSYDRLYLKGGRTMKSKGRWTYPFGSVYVRPSRSGKERWHIYYKTASRRYVREAVKGAANRAEALKVLQQRAIEAFRESNGIKKPKARLKFSEFAETYLAITKHLKDWGTNDSRMRLHLIPFFGKFYLDEITPMQVEDYRSSRLGKTRLGKKIKPITTNRELALLKGMFTKAIDSGHALTNPVKKVKFVPETDSMRERILTHEEEERLMDASVTHFRPFLIIALNTGMRRGEILSLNWPQVDFRSRLVHVIKTKRAKNRIVPMNKTLYETLQALRAEASGTDKVYAWKHVQDAFEKARTAAKLNGLRLHDLRHTFATRLIQSGVDVFTVQKILGHSTITMTMRYCHSFEPEMRAAVEKLDEKFAQSLHNFEPGPSAASGASLASQAGSVN